MIPYAVVAALALTFVSYLIVSARKDKEICAQARKAFLRRHEGWDSYVQAEPMGFNLVQSVIAVNHDSREIVLGTVKSAHRYPWSAIASVEVLKNGHAVSSIDRGSQLAGAAIGGILAGDAGLIAGGSNGRRTMRERVCELGLKVVVDDRENPVHSVYFLHLRNGLFTESDAFRRVSQLADHFHALLVSAVRAEQRGQAPTPLAPPYTTTSELERLWRLKELGALTASEFMLQKGALIAPRSSTEGSP